MPNSLVIFVPLMLLILLGLRRTGFGRLLYAIGDNPVAARLSGARAWQVLIVLYVLSALLAGIAGLLISGLTNTASVTLVDSSLLPSVAASVIGGTSILGGRGGFAGTIVGALILTVLTALLTVLGLPDTVGVTLDMMLHHSAAVARAKTEALVVGDLPFGLAHDSFPKLLGYCRRFLQEGGVKAVKIEGGASLAPAIARLIDAGIPVMGHVGMLPQRVHSAGYRRRGLTPEDQKKILVDAQAVAAAGAFAIVVECVDETFMPKITEAVSVPTIGIGSGRGCDGQILVIHDLLGLTPEPPPFARPEANLHRDAVAAVRRWAAKVRTKKAK